jgi:hypothetical protein
LCSINKFHLTNYHLTQSIFLIYSCCSLQIITEHPFVDISCQSSRFISVSILHFVEHVYSTHALYRVWRLKMCFIFISDLILCLLTLWNTPIAITCKCCHRRCSISNILQYLSTNVSHRIHVQFRTIFVQYVTLLHCPIHCTCMTTLCKPVKIRIYNYSILDIANIQYQCQNLVFVSYLNDSLAYQLQTFAQIQMSEQLICCDYI